jgi:hypothetical protein
MIYTDGVHVVSSKSTEELHEWCEAQGIGRHFYHRGQRFPHYYIPKKRVGEEFPATYVRSRTLIKILLRRDMRVKA